MLRNPVGRCGSCCHSEGRRPLSARGICLLVLLCATQFALAQAPSEPSAPGSDVVARWSSEVQRNVERKAEEAERTMRLVQQIRRENARLADGGKEPRATAWAASLPTASWPSAYADVLHRELEAHGLFETIPKESLLWPDAEGPLGASSTQISEDTWKGNLRRMRELEPLVLQVLRDEGLPAQLLAVPLVESGFNPAALSPKGARGLWQLMPETARRFGLNPDGPRDERLDPRRSTVAAARYLKELYALWGDWALALAAYNAGEQRVQQALARSPAANFGTLASLGLLPEETRNYVPAVLAAARRIRSLSLGTGKQHPSREHKGAVFPGTQIPVGLGSE